MTNEQMQVVFERINEILGTYPRIEIFSDRSFGIRYGFENSTHLYLIGIPFNLVGFPIHSICTIKEKVSGKMITFHYEPMRFDPRSGLRDLSLRTEDLLKKVFKDQDNNDHDDFMVNI